MVEIVSLGGEGILRTNGQHKRAVPMIEEALRLGVRYVIPHRPISRARTIVER